MRIRFTSDQIYETGGIGKGPRFAKGYVLDESGVQKALGLSSAPSPEYVASFLNRWVQRGVAEEVDGRAPVTEPGALDHDANGKKGGAAASSEVSQPLGTEKRGEPTPGLDDSKQVEKIDYSKLTRDELDALAKKREVDITDAKNKGDVIVALEQADLGEDD